MKKKVKSIITAIIALIMVLTFFTSCGNDEKTQGDSSQTAEMTQAEKDFRADNFANGKLSQEVLDSFTPAQLAFASCALFYEWRLQEGIKNGEKWVYTNSSTYSPQSKTFDHLLDSEMYGSNCAMIAAWAFFDMGILEEGYRFYGDTSNQFHGAEKCGKYIGAVCDVTEWNGDYTWSELFDKNMVKPGDVYLTTGHTFCYLGDDKFMACGHDSKWHSDFSAPTEDGSHAVFDSWIVDTKSCSDYSKVVYYQITFKENYIPKTYRNSEGKVVTNPMYDENTSIEYKKGVSAETLTYIKGKITKDTFVFYDGTRTNALSGATCSKENGFRLKAFYNPKQLTDDQLYSDGTDDTYCDIKLMATSSGIDNPANWYDASGNKSSTKDNTYKYYMGFYAKMERTKSVDGFALYAAARDAEGNSYNDLEGFDVLVSRDGKNWTVVYSVTNASASNIWKDVTDERAMKTSDGKAMTRYVTADFTATDAKYVMIGITEIKNQGENPGWFRFTELQAFKN